jgi:hypothetical protein
VKITKARVRQLISESIRKILKEEDEVIRSPSGQDAYRGVLDLLSPIVVDLVNDNTDSDFLERWHNATITADNFNLVPDLDNMIEDSMESIDQNIKEFSESILMSQCNDIFEEALDIVKSGGEIDPSDFVTKITDAYFKDGGDKHAIKVMSGIIKDATDNINGAIESASEKRKKEIEADLRAKKKMEYSSNFPIACAGWFVATDSYGVAIPESCHFQIVFKGEGKVYDVNGADFPLEMNGVELYDINPKKKSPLVAAYQGKENITVPAV